MRALALATLLLLAGCAAREEAPPPRALRFAAFAAPEVAGPEAEGRLLDLVTALSGEPELDLVLVAGPLVGSAEASDREALIGALGSIAAPVYVALAPGEATPELLDALATGVQKHPGTAVHAGPPVAGWQPVAVAPDGALPDAAHADAAGGALPIIAVRAGAAPPPGTVRLLVSPHEEQAFSGERREGRVELRLPPFAAPPHVWALVTVEPTGEVKTTLRALLPEPAPPPAPSPLFVDLPPPGS